MDDYKLLLEKFWNGAASETEKLQLYKIIVEDEEAIKIALQQEPGSGKGDGLLPGASQTILESLHREIGQRASLSIDRPAQPFGLLRWAAALLVIGLASFISWKLYTVQHISGQQEAVAAVFTDINNDSKAIRQVILNDGTVIDLHPQSTLRFKQPFNLQNIRSIALKGKANFKVKHDESKPFEVIANKIKTTDIGTEFCIDVSDENTFRVVLKEGSIRVAAMPESRIRMGNMILKPGEEVHWDFAGKKMILEQTAEKEAKSLARQKGTAAVSPEKLVFEKTPLDKVFAKLEHRSSVRIKRNAEEINELTFTGTIESSDNIETALGIICKLNGLYYHKTKQAFLITKNK